MSLAFFSSHPSVTFLLSPWAVLRHSPFPATKAVISVSAAASDDDIIHNLKITQ